jgi:thiosulfate/3-mercaptopyruvate sulfurtransferase
MLLTLKIFIFFLSIGLTMSACQLTPVHKIKPTSVREDFQPVTPGSSGGTPVGTAALASTASDIPITEQTVLLDARSAFEYSTSHVRGSYHLRWEDFTQKDDKYKGLLVEDLFFHTRRLARMGIGPNTPVVIFGAGPTGDASEGRLAWTLKYLGVADVQIMAIGSTRLPQTSVPTDPKLEVPAWRPQQQPEPTSKPQSVSEQIQSPVKTMSVSSTNTIKNLSDLKEKTQQRTVWIIDVRSEKEYLRQTKEKATMNGNDPVEKLNQVCVHCEVINIPWKHFLTHEGTCNPQVIEELKNIQILKSEPQRKTLIMTSLDGVSSALATYCLQGLLSKFGGSRDSSIKSNSNSVNVNVFPIEGGYQAIF